MINLLPPELKQNYTYARRNTSLLHTVVAFCLGIVGLAALSVAGILYLHQTANTYNTQAAAAEAELASQNQSSIEKQIKDISGNLKLAVTVLSQEVLFSKLLAQLAVITPSKVSFSNFKMITSGAGVDITALTTDYTAATQLQVNMNDPTNKIFAKVDIINISCEADAAFLATIYPCKASYRALFAPDSQFSFIYSKTKATP